MLAKGVLRLDLKADNVLVDTQGESVVIDFSHCCEYESSQDSSIVPAASIGPSLHGAPELRTASKSSKSVYL